MEKKKGVVETAERRMLAASFMAAMLSASVPFNQGQLVDIAKDAFRAADAFLEIAPIKWTGREPAADGGPETPRR